MNNKKLILKNSTIIMLIINYFNFTLNDPLSRFPQGGKALISAPSPVGESWEGGLSDIKLMLYY
jgi:hypothetical protein